MIETALNVAESITTTPSVFSWSGITQIRRELKPDTTRENTGERTFLFLSSLFVNGAVLAMFVGFYYSMNVENYADIEREDTISKVCQERVLPSMALAPRILTVSIPRSVPGNPARAT